MLALGIQLVVLLPQLINLGGEIVDSRQAFAQKQFEAADSALTVFKLRRQQIFVFRPSISRLSSISNLVRR